MADATGSTAPVGRREWPPKPATLAVLAMVSLGAVGGLLLILQVLESPRVPDRVVPIPAEAVVVGDVGLPAEGTGGSQAEGAQRTISIASAELDAERLAEAVVDGLEQIGWQLEPGPLGPGQLVSSEDLDGEYDLDLRVRTGVDGPPLGVRSPPWEHGQPYVSVSVGAGQR